MENWCLLSSNPCAQLQQKSLLCILPLITALLHQPWIPTPKTNFLGCAPPNKYYTGVSTESACQTPVTFTIHPPQCQGRRVSAGVQPAPALLFPVQQRWGKILACDSLEIELVPAVHYCPLQRPVERFCSPSNPPTSPSTLTRKSNY